MRRWLLDWFVGLDTFTGGFFPRSLPGQTISSRAATARDHGHWWGCVLCRFLDWLEANHCNDAVTHDIERAQAVIDDLKGQP